MRAEPRPPRRDQAPSPGGGGRGRVGKRDGVRMISLHGWIGK
jgi:hypothetical protein